MYEHITYVLLQSFKHPFKIIMIGVCGREGAGKTSLASFLCPYSRTTYRNVRIREDQVMSEIVKILFGDLRDDLRNASSEIVDPIWKLTHSQAVNLIEKLLRDNIDPDLDLHSARSIRFVETREADDWVQISMADPLKLIATIVFGFKHEILLGDTQHYRDLRETILSREYKICGKLSGRRCLEYLGTDVLRNKFDQGIWIKIFERDSRKYLKNGIRVICPDVRYENELEAINVIGGTLIIIYRDERELVISDSDRENHPSKWMFLTFYEKAERLVRMHNCGTLLELKDKLTEVVAKL